MPRLIRNAVLAALAFTATACDSPQLPAQTLPSEHHGFRVVEVVRGLEHPWSIAFLPDGGMLVTERAGRVRLITAGRLDPRPLSGAPAVYASGQGGMFDVAPHPDFVRNRFVYLAYAAPIPGGAHTRVTRYRYDAAAHSLTAPQQIFQALPAATGGRHFGGRLAFDRAGYLFITVGERGDDYMAQNLGAHHGSVIRLHDDGRVPADNPFVGRPDLRPEIYSYGHRNPQGLARHPETGAIWEHEHGARGGDEVNLIRRGRNYGWPVISYGTHYSGLKIGEGAAKPGMEQPLHYWVPSIAPSGMAFYTGDKFPRWKNNIFVGALAGQLLARLEFDGTRFVKEERLLEDRIGRIRAVRTGPDGFIYLATDDSDGRIVRLEPAR
jgi:glucose/arabinose dehydrogenase